MKFTTVIAVVAEEHEEAAIDIAKANGAGGVTILNGRGIGLGDKTTFFGLSYERSDSILIFIMEEMAAKKVITSITDELELEKPGNGLVFSLPIENLAGITEKQMRKFKENMS